MLDLCSPITPWKFVKDVISTLRVSLSDSAYTIFQAHLLFSFSGQFKVLVSVLDKGGLLKLLSEQKCDCSSLDSPSQYQTAAYIVIILASVFSKCTYLYGSAIHRYNLVVIIFLEVLFFLCYKRFLLRLKTYFEQPVALQVFCRKYFKLPCASLALKRVYHMRPV